MRPEESHRLYLEGIALFNREEFYDCHDALEEMWLEEFTPDRLFFQGLIQVAVGFYHFTTGRLGAGRSMLDKALQKLGSYPDHHRGVDLGDLKRQVLEWKQMLDRTIREKSTPAARPFPKIKYEPERDEGFR